MKFEKLTANEIGIRMYRVGFGDCFLISFPGHPRRHKMLVDCGSIASYKKKSIDTIVDLVIEDARAGEADGEPHIDVAVCTHRHRDHVAGFAKDGWDKVHVREVWMPWTEDPKDPEARRILHAQASLALGLVQRFASPALAGDKYTDIANSAANALLDRYEQADELVEAKTGEDAKAALRVRRALIALNALSNDEAMETLHHGLSGEPERFFLPEKEQAGSARRTRSFTTSALPGAEIHILGPSRDEDVIRDMDPPCGKSYFRAAPLEGEEPTGGWPAFGKEWLVPSQAAKSIEINFANPFTADERQRLAQMNTLDPSILAASLDSSVNGTSLMFIVGFKGKKMMFSGDAQWGTWRRALDDPEWRDLMSRSRFLKVGHHGSHNATPTEYVEEVMPDGQGNFAMISVRPYEKWPEIPRKPLLKELAKRAEIVRSDEEGADVAAPFQGDANYVDLVIPV